MTELLPCPFCGRKAQYSEESRFHICWVYCPGCGAASGYRNTEAEAVEAWNTRADTEYGAVPATEGNMAAHGWVRERTCKNVVKAINANAPMEFRTDNFKCSVCGELFCADGEGVNYPIDWAYCPNCGARVEAVGE